MLTQKNHITSPYLRSKDIVLMGRYPYKNYFKDYSDEDYRIVDEVMRVTGSYAFKEGAFIQLSGGEAQRVLFAKAFAQQPQLLLLDKPTNHLDIEHKINLMKLVQSFSGTAIMVLHNLCLAYTFCNNVLIMDNGRVVAQGKPEVVMTPQLLERVFKVPFYLAKHGDRKLLYF